METSAATPRPLRSDERGALLAIINAAAQRYRGAIPDDCWREPYMTEAELEAELRSGVEFCGIDVDGSLVAVMGVQSMRDVRLIRHAYVQPAAQGRGLGTRLLLHSIADAGTPLLVGTWAAAEWAIGFYRRNGFALASPEATPALLATYWTISNRQAEVSVVLRRQG